MRLSAMHLLIFDVATHQLRFANPQHYDLSSFDNTPATHRIMVSLLSADARWQGDAQAPLYHPSMQYFAGSLPGPKLIMMKLSIIQPAPMQLLEQDSEWNA